MSTTTSTPTPITFPSLSHSLTISAHLFTPTPQSANRHGATIIISHPMTGVKEQTSTTYARHLSAAGFHALAFDAAYQGESTGYPRGLEDPHQRAEDIKAAVTYVSTLGNRSGGTEIDPARIGVLGICASGGYASYAAQTDGRIRALATVSAACVGRMTRAGGAEKELNLPGNDESAEAIEGARMAAAGWRTANAGVPVRDQVGVKMFDADPALVTKETPGFFKEASGYYGTERGKHERSTQVVVPASYDLMLGYDSFRFQHLIAPRALLMIVGSDAQTRHYSEVAVEGAREPKELLVLEGDTHFTLYDGVERSGPALVRFFEKYLA